METKTESTQIQLFRRRLEIFVSTTDELVLSPRASNGFTLLGAGLGCSLRACQTSGSTRIRTTKTHICEGSEGQRHEGSTFQSLSHNFGRQSADVGHYRTWTHSHQHPLNYHTPTHTSNQMWRSREFQQVWNVNRSGKPNHTGGRNSKGKKSFKLQLQTGHQFWGSFKKKDVHSV